MGECEVAGYCDEDTGEYTPATPRGRSSSCTTAKGLIGYCNGDGTCCEYGAGGREGEDDCQLDSALMTAVTHTAHTTGLLPTPVFYCCWPCTQIM